MRQIAAIQSLRALAALMVVVGHAQTAAAVAALKAGTGFTPLPLLPWGAGVDLFFVISGFIMVVSSERLFGVSGGATTFAARRLKRIVPLYWLATSLYVAIQLLTHKKVGGGDVVASYLFWPWDVYGDGVLRPLYSLGWTLNYEMFFYAMFAAAIILSRRACVLVVSAVLVVGVVTGRLLPFAEGPLAFWTQPIVLEFALGMDLGLLWCGGLRLGLMPRLSLALAGIALLVFDGMDAAHRAADWITPNDFLRVASWGLPAAMIVAAGALGRRRAEAPKGLAGTVALGDASYALYLVHPFVVGVAMRLWTMSGLATHAGYWPFIAAGLAASIAVALAVHRWFEMPVARSLALRRIDGKSTLAESPAVP